MIRIARPALIFSFAGSLLAVCPESVADTCASQRTVAKQITAQAEEKGFDKPHFRVTRQSDGQALLYWDFGGESRSFYAITFRSDGCAVLTDSGKPRRFIFPKGAYNTGVFEEMDVFDGVS